MFDETKTKHEKICLILFQPDFQIAVPAVNANYTWGYYSSKTLEKMSVRANHEGICQKLYLSEKDVNKKEQEK